MSEHSMSYQLMLDYCLLYSITIYGVNSFFAVIRGVMLNNPVLCYTIPRLL